MSKNVADQLRKYPLLSLYAQEGLVNLMALARFLQPEGNTSALGMELRRYLATQEASQIKPFDFAAQTLQVVSRNHIRKIILHKNRANHHKCLSAVQKISEDNYFVSLVTGEREIVLITDCPAENLLKIPEVKTLIKKQTDDLGFLSINLALKMRSIPGVYSLITSALATENISIHAFHTIGGEIIILFVEKDLLRAQEVLQSLFK